MSNTEFDYAFNGYHHFLYLEGHRDPCWLAVRAGVAMHSGCVLA